MRKIINPSYLWIPLVIYYLIGVAGTIFPEFSNISLELLNSGAKRSPEEDNFIEHLEAFFWLIAVISYATLIIKRHSKSKKILWHIFILLFCFFALGEEISWGQHILQYTPPNAVSEVNTQNEFNIHNLHIGKSLGLSPSNPAYRYLGSATQYLNPLFYLLCIIIWLLLPITLDNFQLKEKYQIFNGYPSQKKSFYYAFFVSILSYLLVDNYLFDAGELFELTLATMSAIAGTSIKFQ